MNKILLSKKGRNHIRFMPMKNLFELPVDEKDKILWCQDKFNDLQSRLDVRNHYLRRNVKKGYSISVWEMDDKFYLAHCIRNEFGTYNDTIYISSQKDDMINIAKFLVENIDTIMKDYREQILDAKDEIARLSIA